MVNYINIIGISAGILTTVAFFPQVFKTYKSKSAKDLSLNMLVILFFGILLWFFYGLLITEYPIIIANAVGSLLALTLLIMKLKYK